MLIVLNFTFVTSY